MKKIIRITIVSILVFAFGDRSITHSFAQDVPQGLVGTTERSSISSEGKQANKGSYPWGVQISADGRYVAFNSDSSNLVAGDTNGDTDVFVHDRVTGETTRVSISSDGMQGNSGSNLGGISADGRYVIFSSFATNLVEGDLVLCYSRNNPAGWNCRDIFVHDRLTGETSLVSVASDGTHGNYDSNSAVISSDGRYVVFVSDAWNLVDGDTNICHDFRGYIDPCGDVFVHDRLTGDTTRVSVASDGTEGNYYSENGSISADGRLVTFSSLASNLVDGDTHWCEGGYSGFINCTDVFVHDRQTGETTRVSVASDGSQGDEDSTDGRISEDGRFVVFSSSASNLVTGDTNESSDIFVHDMQTGETTRVSVASDGTQGDGGSAGSGISADGRYVVFSSWATNLVEGDANYFCNFYSDPNPHNCADIFLHDHVTGETSLVSVAWDGVQGNSYSESTTISNDGHYVAFTSQASNLVVGDTNGTYDVFVRDRAGSIFGFTVSGHIEDLDGNPLPGVTISTTYGLTTTTDFEGNYTLLNLPSGTYWLTAALDDITFIPLARETSVPPSRISVDFIQGFFAILPLISR